MFSISPYSYKKKNNSKTDDKFCMAVFRLSGICSGNTNCVLVLLWLFFSAFKPATQKPVFIRILPSTLMVCQNSQPGALNALFSLLSSYFTGEMVCKNEKPPEGGLKNRKNLLFLCSKQGLCRAGFLQQINEQQTAHPAGKQLSPADSERHRPKNGHGHSPGCGECKFPTDYKGI